MRSKIIQAANRLFVMNGYHAISMREIGEACGISKAALYYHFKDKEALFLAVLDDYLDEMGAIIQVLHTTETGARPRLTAFVRAIFAQPVERRAIIRLASQDFGQLSREAQAAFGQTYQEKFIGRIVAWMEEGMASGEIRTCNPGMAAWIFLGMLYPFSYPSQSQAFMSVDAPEVVEIFLDGLGAG